MNIRFASAASVLAVAGTLSAPAFAQGPAAAFETAAPVMLSEQAAANLVATVAVPVLDGLTNEVLSGVTIAASGEATPVIITASSAAPGLAAGNGEVVITSAAIAAATAAAAQDSGTGGRDESFTVVLNQDSFFGFYPTFNALIPVSDKMDLSVYGILWTTADFSSGAGQGRDLWTEFGIGVNIYAMDGNLTIKPQIGITNGFLLSQGTDDGVGGNVFDGVVPSLTMNYSDDSFEAEFYGGYYAAVRNRNDRGLDFLHTWVNAGAKFTDNFSAGAHYEILSLTRAAGGNAANVYHWVGPYVQFKLENGFFTRFTSGWDVGEGNSGDFYKLAVGFSF